MTWNVHRIEHASQPATGNSIYAVLVRSEREPEWLEIPVVLQPTGDASSDRRAALRQAATAADSFAREAFERPAELSSA